MLCSQSRSFAAALHLKLTGPKACCRAWWKPVPSRARQPTLVCSADWLQRSRETNNCHWAPAKHWSLAVKLILRRREGTKQYVQHCHLPAALVWKQIATKRKAPEPDEEEDEADVVFVGRSSARSTAARAAGQAGAAQVAPTGQAGGQAPVAEAAAPGDSSQVRLVGGLAAPLDAVSSQ